MPLCVSVHPNMPYLLLFSLSYLPQSLMLDCLYFSPITRYHIPVLRWVNVITVGELSKCFAIISVGYVQTPIL